MLSHPRGGALGSLLLLFVHLFLFQSPLTTASTLEFTVRRTNCDGESYNQSSTFAANLGALLSSLTSKSSSSNSATANVTTGPTTGHVFGLYMCQGDLTGQQCHDCINNATAAITSNCPDGTAHRQAILWSDFCQVRYSDLNFFGVPDTYGFNMTNPTENTSSTAPLAAVADLVATAPFQRPLMFALKASGADSLYALAQCTADLSTNGCSKCLNTILADIKTCCTEYNGWRYLAASCWVRYEATPFLQNLNSTYTEIIRYNCSVSSFPPNSLGVMESDLSNLLSNLTSKAQPTGYYNTTVGESPNEVYGLALCRGDLATPGDDCNNCLGAAGGTIAGICPNRTEGIKWYEKCLMRYSNQNFFGMVDLAGQTLCGVQQLSQAASDATVKLATRLVDMAANEALMVAAGKEAVDSMSTSYVLVQCTRDLRSEGCKKCLEKGLSEVASKCNQTNGWRYLSGSCTLRYEVSPFFDTSAISPPEGTPPVPQPPAPTKEEEGGKKKSSKAVIIVAPVLGAILLGLLLYCLWWKLRRRNDKGRAQFKDLTPVPGSDLPLMDLAIIQVATNNFSDANKLGEGGFGPVYKGMLRGGKEIAVKRLSTKSKQGAAEFKNELKLIAKLQHRNLVRMLGCCAEGEEKLLIYEYLPNKSLDAFLFDPSKRAQLDWSRRVHMIVGIAKGLLYLHEDSLLKVIHRDLKASNVLLDSGMNPKISDFGLAKIFGADESEAITGRVVGTYGYMAPEYAMDGIFSVKSDVYSFGVLLLEIVSGEKNGRAHFEKYGQTLLRHAWQLWNEDKVMELMDSLLGDSYQTNEAKKCIHIGLLCVQENAEERPTMSLVVHMLRSEQMVFPQPTQPPTFTRHRPSASNLSSTMSRTQSTTAHSINELTESVVEPR